MKKKIIKNILAIILLILYLILGKQFNFFLFCPIKKILGLYCPGCGVTRMLLSILEGNLYQAFRYNPLLFIMLPLFFIYYLDYFYSLYKNKKSKISSLEPKIWYVLIFLFTIYGILRNIPFFDFLKPTIIP